ncbi:hypothetical protein G6F56_010741 [Rhizopus delemar]|nr:hypothetical protein G6F56_010741 [Rhizopus delemar]
MSSISDIVQEYTDMRQGLKQLGIELDTHWKDQTDLQDRFHVVMQEHRRSVIERFEEIEVLYINMDAKWKHLMLFYGENPQRMRPDEFFQIFSRFIHSWKTCAFEELKYAQAKEREEKRSEEVKMLSVVKPKDNDGPLVDDLLAKLRSGESLMKTRKSKIRTRAKPKKPCHRDSISSSASSFVPSISAEDLLRNLQADK